MLNASLFLILVTVVNALNLHPDPNSLRKLRTRPCKILQKFVAEIT